MLKKMPADLLRFTGGARPDADGMASYNQDGFKSPEFQRGAMHYLVRAAVEATLGVPRRVGGRSMPRFGSKMSRGVSAARVPRTAGPRPRLFGWLSWIRRCWCCEKAS